MAAAEILVVVVVVERDYAGVAVVVSGCVDAGMGAVASGSCPNGLSSDCPIHHVCCTLVLHLPLEEEEAWPEGEESVVAVTWLADLVHSRRDFAFPCHENYPRDSSLYRDRDGYDPRHFYLHLVSSLSFDPHPGFRFP